MARTYNRRVKPKQKPHSRTRKRRATSSISQRVSVVVNPLFLKGPRRRFVMRGRRNVAPQSMFGLPPTINVQLPVVTPGGVATIQDRVGLVPAQPIPGGGLGVGGGINNSLRGGGISPMAHEDRNERQFAHNHPSPFGGGAGRARTPQTTMALRQPESLMRELGSSFTQPSIAPTPSARPVPEHGATPSAMSRLFGFNNQVAPAPISRD
jgi:hypothetical protein